MMKTALFVTAALVVSAPNAFASEAETDPGEYRAPGVTYSASETAFVSPDTTATPGETMPGSSMAFTAPDTSSGPGMTYPTSAGRLATTGGH